ncbi:MAG TPA: DVUA0089 family protein, partial [Opitutaceae bacterium]|nr:DVUA0089 family protein [Opitutaceae bacterium]
ISSPSTFSATTTTTSGSGTWGTTGDTQLFLFKLDGTGILANDDTSGNLQSHLPAGDTHLTALTAGDYLIGVTVYNLDPRDAFGNPIFQDTFPGLDLPLTAGVLDHWQNNESPRSVGAYTITLTGASYVTAVPEPATTGLLFALGGGVAVWRARRRAA